MYMSSSLQERAKLFLERHDIDVTVRDYLLGVSEEVANGSMDFEEFVEVVLLMTRDVASFERQELIRCLTPDTQEGPSEVQDSEPQSVTYDPEKLSSLMQKTNISEASAVSEVPQQGAHSTPQAALHGNIDVAVLRDVTGCKNASDAFLQHIVRQHKGNLEAIVDHILDSKNIADEEALWALKQPDQKQMARNLETVQREMKRAIVENYAFADRSSRDKAKATPWGEKQAGTGQSAAGKVRYREGIKVTSKGEKHIYEQIQAEWDGGSRGKVYTKGKRGKGFM